jgi:signal peptidase I
LDENKLDENQNEVPVVIEPRYDETVAGIVNTLQMVVIALSLAFIVRTFYVEAFRIPTGSMAETLSGSHYHIRCEMCGFKYDLGHDTNIKPKAKCINCSYIIPSEMQVRPSNGDRIFVMKSIYQLQEPRRWDVVVFRNPLDPRENYIKRLIATPGESLEIIDGDIYIDGVIQRKPEHVQNEHWMPIYDSRYQPYVGDGGSVHIDDFNGDFTWQVPFANADNSEWEIRSDDRFWLTSDGQRLHTLSFDSLEGEKFRAIYGYNNSSRYKMPPLCGDLKIEFDVESENISEMRIGAVLAKYGNQYRALVDPSGTMSIESVKDDQVTQLVSAKLSGFTCKNTKIRFCNVDHLLVFEVGKQKLEHDMGRSLGDCGDRTSEAIPTVAIVAAGEVSVSNVAIFRDTYYIDGFRALPGNPFKLGDDEFFMCGDNSMDSFDSRLWASDGKGNNDKIFTQGIVPREHLVGKAFFLYWGDAFSPFENTLPLIPNFSEMKRIYGGVK